MQLGIKSVKRSAIAKCTILKLKNKKEEFSPLLLSSKCIFVDDVSFWVLWFGFVVGFGGFFYRTTVYIYHSS